MIEDGLNLLIQFSWDSDEDTCSITPFREEDMAKILPITKKKAEDWTEEEQNIIWDYTSHIPFGSHNVINIKKIQLINISIINTLS